MTDTVGYFPYLNLWPFVRGLPDDIERVVAPPRALTEYARAGRLDVAVLPTADVGDLTDRYEVLGDFGLAVAGPVWSVLLLTRRPIEALTGARVCVTSESSTSVRLLALLLRVRYGVPTWQWWPTPEGADAWLVIGDTALAIARDRGIARADGPSLSSETPTPGPSSSAPPSDGRPETALRAVSRSWSPARDSVLANRAWRWTYDLADEWTRWQGLPFVFAVWVVRRDRGGTLRDRWHRRLSEALAESLPRLHDPGRTDGLSALEVTYLRRFRYRLGSEEWAGVRRFWELMGAEAPG